MKKSARAHACTIYKDVIDKNLYVNIYVPRYLSLNPLSLSDKSRVTDLVMGTFRWQLLLETIISNAAKRQVTSLENDLLTVLRLGSYEILFGKTPKQILVSEWVNESVLFIGERAKPIANAVFRRVSEKNLQQWQDLIEVNFPNSLDKVWSHPQWIIDKYKEVISNQSEVVELLKYNNSPPVNWMVEQKHSEISQREALSPTAKKANSVDLQDVKSNSKAKPRIQDAASQAAGFLLANFDVKPNETSWLDACAAPGGKTAMLAQERKNQDIWIHAYDIHEHKKVLIESNTKNYKNIKINIADARLSPWGSQSFDRVLLDAPCTGLGAIRRRAESRWTKQPSMIGELVNGAKELFDACLRSLKDDGLLCYVVCSPIKEETDDFVQWALKQYANIELIKPDKYLPVFNNANIENLVDLSDWGIRFWPHKHETDAMFIALFRKLPS